MRQLVEYIDRRLSNNFSWNGVQVNIKDPVTASDFSIKRVLQQVEKSVPRHLTRGIKQINIGQFEFLSKRHLQGLYTDSSIYVTNVQDSEEDLLDDIVHEIAHSVEKEFFDLIYADQKVKREFLKKRKKTWQIFKQQGLTGKMKYNDFINLKYDSDFDSYIYKELGYDKIRSITSNIFCSPYGITSLREYFANGFEEFFYHKNLKKVRDLSPVLYNKFTQLIEIGENTNEFK